MRTVIFVFLLFLTTPLAFTQGVAFLPPSQSEQVRNVGRAPKALLWNFQLFYVGPHNARLFEQEVKKAEESLKPGETVQFRVIARQVGSILVFQRLERADIPVIKPVEDMTMALIELSKSQFAIKSGLLSALSKAEFDEVKRQLDNSPLTYADHCFGTEALNALNGYSVDATDIAAIQRLRGRLELQDLTKEDLAARAVAEGVVILIAEAAADTYRVFNIETGQVDRTAYPKGEFIKSLGGTVWLYTKRADGTEYTTIYANLDKIAVEPGRRTNRSETVLGQWKTFSSPTLNLSIWRVHGAEQRFLRETGEPKPYCVLPGK